MADYEEIYEKKCVDGCVLGYGVFKGSNTVLLIVVGQNGSLYGYHDKYVNMAQRYHQEYGVTAIVVTNPYNGNNHLEETMRIIHTLKKENYTIYAMGISNGGRLLAQYSYLYPEVKKLLLVNSPLMINWHKTKSGLEKFQGEYIEFVYGTKDQSYPYTEIVHKIETSSTLKLTSIQDADHQFRWREEEFEELAQSLFD